MNQQYIITCGTSQIEAEKIEIFRKNDQIRPFLTSSLGEYPLILDKKDKPQKEYEKHFKIMNNLLALKKGLSALWGNRKDYLQRDENPFGAELSTLIALENDEITLQEGDRVVLLASDTYPGFWCAILAAEMVCEKYSGVEAEIEIVRNLEDHPVNPEEGILFLVDTIHQLITRESNGLLKTRLLITGGYKSIIPHLTMMAFLYALEMIYLYENSDCLVKISFWKEKQGEKEKEFLKRLNDKKMWEHAGDALQAALKKRTSQEW